jgi:hypothetical protein
MKKRDTVGHFVPQSTNRSKVPDVFSSLSHPLCEFAQGATSTWAIITARKRNNAIVDIEANVF